MGEFSFSLQKYGSAEIGKGGDFLKRLDELILVTCGVTQDGFGIRTSARLIDISKVKGENAVNDVVMIFGQVCFQGFCKGAETGAFSQAIMVEDMKVFGVRLARCGEYVDVEAERRQGS